MDNVLEIIGQFLQDEGYAIQGSDNEGFTVRYQMSMINIYPDEADKTFCSVLLPVNMGPCENEEEETARLQLCNNISSKQKVVKAFLFKDGIALTYEFNFENEDNLTYQIRTGLESVTASRAYIRMCSMASGGKKDDEE